METNNLNFGRFRWYSIGDGIHECHGECVLAKARVILNVMEVFYFDKKDNILMTDKIPKNLSLDEIKSNVENCLCTIHHRFDLEEKIPLYNNKNQFEVNQGISLRDTFAGLAMQAIFSGYLINPPTYIKNNINTVDIAKLAYSTADAMLKARGE